MSAPRRGGSNYRSLLRLCNCSECPPKTYLSQDTVELHVRINGVRPDDGDESDSSEDLPGVLRRDEAFAPAHASRRCSSSRTSS